MKQTPGSGPTTWLLSLVWLSVNKNKKQNSINSINHNFVNWVWQYGILKKKKKMKLLTLCPLLATVPTIHMIIGSQTCQ